MCILCVVRKWARRAATILPWLVIPLFVLWALSQLFPPGFRLEATSPQVTCFSVLLISLFWYEILMPKLLTWRARRNAFLRERKRIEAIEMQKLRKTAIRRCRNCLTAYREQNPVGGKYMCSYCGHISRRPVLDIPGGGISGGRGLEGMVGSGIISDLVGKTGKIWSEKVGLERPRWGCGNGWDCSENDGWILGRNGGSFLASEEPCLAENSYCGFVIFVCRLLGFFSLILKWLWRKVLRMGSVGEEVSMDGERRSQYRKGETGPNIQESKGEKAKRKAEEKRLARLGKEMLEEEERKQREEVARLVEEQRRLRDDQLEAIKARERASAMEREREVRREREAEKRRLAKTKDKDKDKDKGSFNSDGEDIEKRAMKESEKKCEYDKKSDIERRDVTKSTENPRPHGSEMGHGSKGFTGNASKVGGSQYLDRVKGSFLAPSRASSGSTVTSFFKKGFETSTGSSTKVSKHVGSLEYMQNTAINGSPPLHSKKPSSSAWNGMAWTKVWGKGMGFGSDAHPKERKISSSASGDALFCGQRMGNSISDGDYKNAEAVRLPVKSEPQEGSSTPTQTKAWQQLFTGSSASSARPNSSSLSHLQFDLSVSSNTSKPVLSSSMDTNPVFLPASDALFHPTQEEVDFFEDPSYVPDPEFLLGPVSESLDNFSSDLGTGFSPKRLSEGSHGFDNSISASDIKRPSPIESPLSKLLSSGISTEINHVPGQHRETLDLPSQHSAQTNNFDEQRSWHMWDTPLGQDSLGLIYTPPPNWLSPHASNPFSDSVPVHDDLWSRNAVFQPLTGDADSRSASPCFRKEVSRSPDGLSSDTFVRSGGPPLGDSPSCWSRNVGACNVDWGVPGGAREGVGKPSTRPHIGGLFSTSDVHSPWSFN